MFTHHNNKNSVDLHLNTNNQKYDLATQDHANQITNFIKQYIKLMILFWD